MRKIDYRFIPKRSVEWAQVRAALLRETRDCCHYCDRSLTWGASTIDHQVPRCQGGTDHFANLVIACRPCNSSKGGLDVEQWEARSAAR